MKNAFYEVMEMVVINGAFATALTPVRKIGLLILAASTLIISIQVLSSYIRKHGVVSSDVTDNTKDKEKR